MLRLALSLIALYASRRICAQAQPVTNPFPTPIEGTAASSRVNFAEFAVIPDAAGEAPRMMHLVDEPGTSGCSSDDARAALQRQLRRQAVADMSTSTRPVEHRRAVAGLERGFQSFAFHPQFNQRGTRGYGKFYTYTDTIEHEPRPTSRPARRRHPRHGAARVDGEESRPRPPTTATRRAR